MTSSQIACSNLGENEQCMLPSPVGAMSAEEFNRLRIRSKSIIEIFEENWLQMRNRCFLAMLALFVASSGYCQPQVQRRPRLVNRNATDPAYLASVADRIVEKYMQEKRVPGLVLAVVRGGKV